MERISILALLTPPPATLAPPKITQDTVVLNSDEETKDKNVQVTSIAAPLLAFDQPITFNYAKLHWTENHQVKMLNSGYSSYNWYDKMVMKGVHIYNSSNIAGEYSLYYY